MRKTLAAAGMVIGIAGLLATSVGAQSGPQIAYSPTSFKVMVAGPGELVMQTLRLTDTAPVPLDWQIGEALTDCGVNAADIPWVSADPITGTLPGGGSQAVDVTFDSTGLTLGKYSGLLCVTSNAENLPLVAVPLALGVGDTVDGAAAPALSLPGLVAAALIFLGLGAASLVRTRARA